MLRTIVETMRRSTRRTLADARQGRHLRARTIRESLQRQRVAMLGRLHALLAGSGHELDPDTLQARVLGVLAAHPNGIGSREIGNELGIDWRSVTAVTSRLVARGAAQQIEQVFYPSAKASPK
jgi:hypothetical protein